MESQQLVPVTYNESAILFTKGAHLPRYYDGVTIKNRFPAKSIIHLTAEEKTSVIADCDHFINSSIQQFEPQSWSCFSETTKESGQEVKVHVPDNLFFIMQGKMHVKKIV